MKDGIVGEKARVAGRIAIMEPKSNHFNISVGILCLRETPLSHLKHLGPDGIDMVGAVVGDDFGDGVFFAFLQHMHQFMKRCAVFLRGLNTITIDKIWLGSLMVLFY